MKRNNVHFKNALVTQEDTPRYGKQDNTHIAQAVIMDDQYDVALFASSIHAIGLEGVSSDFVLGEPTPAQRVYITEMYKIAIIFKNVLPNKDIGDRVFRTIMADANMHIILARNKPTNSLLQWILGVPKEPPAAESAPSETAFKKLINKMKGEKKEEGTDDK